ncbi:hypothetical protein IFR05_004559, partial [Cadophora sp. M221]
MSPVTNYFKIHATKSDYDKAFGEAQAWAIENPDELPSFAARIYFVKEDALRQSISRSKRKKDRNPQGLQNQHGGNNKILTKWQEEAIRQYCYQQWEAGMGATYDMDLGTITYLRQEVENEDEQLELPNLPPSRPHHLWNTAAAIQSFIGRDPTLFSNDSKELFRRTMSNTAVELHKAHLTTIEHATLQEKIKAEGTRKKISRQSIHKGGSSATVGDLREKIRIRDESEKSESLKKARRALKLAIRRSTEALRVAGVQARRENRERKKTLDFCMANDTFPAPEDLILIREPDKNPTPLEAVSKTPEGHPKYLHAVLQLEKEFNGELDGEEILFRIGNTHKEEGLGVKYIESSPPPKV